MKSIVLLCLLSTVAWTPRALAAQGSAFSYVEDIYALSTVAKMNWFQAEAFCAAQGYTLVSIGEDTTQAAIIKIIQNSELQRVLTEPIWTSGTNLAVSSQWNWFSTGATFQYRNFDREPSRSYRCVGLNVVTGSWGAYNCNEQRYFICQTKCPPN